MTKKIGRPILNKFYNHMCDEHDGEMMADQLQSSSIYVTNGQMRNISKHANQFHHYMYWEHLNEKLDKDLRD